MTERLGTLLAAVFVTLLAVAVFAPAVDNDFVWDDPIVFERQLPFFDSAGSVFFPPQGIPQFSEHYYRPLVVVTYLADEALAAALRPEAERDAARRVVFHLSPVLFHALATLLLFRLALAFAGPPAARAARDVGAAAAAAVLFAVHPIHVESVAWMAGRSDVLCTVFVLGALLAWVAWRRTRRIAFTLAAAACAFLALLAKEAALGLWLVVPLVDWFVGREDAPAPAETRPAARRPARAAAPAVRRKAPAAWLGYLGLAAATLAYFALRSAALGQAGSRALSGSPEIGRLFGAIGWYVRKVLWPPPQSVFVGGVPGGATAVLGGLAVVAFIVALVVLGRRRAAGPELLGAGLFFAGLALSLSITLWPGIAKAPLAERYLYLPSAGAAILAGALLARLAARVPLRAAWRPALPVAVALFVMIPAAAATVARERTWSDDMAFWLDAVEKAPDEGVPHLHLGIAYTERRDYVRAEEQYRLALRTYRPTQKASLAKAHNDLGTVLMRVGRFAEAIAEFRAALALDPSYETPHYNWYLALMSTLPRDPEQRGAAVREAAGHLDEALRLNPRYVKAHLQYGVLMSRLGQPARAREHFEIVRRLAPASAEGQAAQEQLNALSATSGP